MVPYISFCIVMVSDGSLWVVVGPLAFLWIPIGRNVSSLVLILPYLF